MPPADDEVVSATTGAASTTGAAIPPAKAVEAARVRAAARANFFILISVYDLFSRLIRVGRDRIVARGSIKAFWQRFCNCPSRNLNKNCLINHSLQRKRRQFDCRLSSDTGKPDRA
jgi:hypothetical protein